MNEETKLSQSVKLLLKILVSEVIRMEKIEERLACENQILEGIDLFQLKE